MSVTAVIYLLYKFIYYINKKNMSSFNHQIKSDFCLIMIIIEYNLPWQPDGDPPPNEKPRKKSKVKSQSFNF